MAILLNPGISSHRRESRSEFGWLVMVLMLAMAPFLDRVLLTNAWAQPYRGKVVDAEGQPLEGAVFVIVWSKKPIITMDGPEYFHSAKETLTDANGEFSIDGSPGLDWNPFTYVTNNPAIAIFKPGYGPFPYGRIREGMPPIMEMMKAMTSEAGVLVKLPKLTSQEEMRKYTGPEQLGIPTNTPYEDIPILIRLINVARKLAGLSSPIGSLQ